MAELYWNPAVPSAYNLYSDGSNWHVGSNGGPTYGAVPGASDNIYFLTNSVCAFDQDVTVNSFSAESTGGTFNTPLSQLTITVAYIFSISTASPGQGYMFQGITGGPATSKVVVRVVALAGSPYVAIGEHQIGTLYVNLSGGGTVTLASSNPLTSMVYPFKCYGLLIDSGNVQFSVADCDGAQLGYPGSTSWSAPAITLSQYGNKSLYAEFPASKPIIMYGGIQAFSFSASDFYNFYWATDTVMEFRGYNSTVQIVVAPIPASIYGAQQPRWLPYVYNYLGEDVNGTPVASGGTLEFSSGVYTIGAPIFLFGLVCNGAGSVSGTFGRNIQLGAGATGSFYDMTISGTTPYGNLAPLFSMNGVVSGLVEFRSASPTSQSTFNFVPATAPAYVQTTYTELTGIVAVTVNNTEYYAYTDDGNVDGGLNVNWLFAPASAGFLGFFMP